MLRGCQCFSLRNSASRDALTRRPSGPLAPLLQKRGLQLISHKAGNFTLLAYPGLIVKDSYWRWPERNFAGNAIDFAVQVFGLPFHEATLQTTGT